jgi:membrane protein DedA with SNARE-associated domain
MSESLAVHDVIRFVERHGYALLFFWVLAEQSAIPVPSAPLLLAAGVLIRTGKMHLLPAFLCCLTGALIADTIWFLLGRHAGRRVLRLVCRVSLEPDSCVRQTENAFLRYGMNSLLVSKFVPGLNAVAAPLAGNSENSFWRFLVYDVAGASIWAATYLAIGYVFSEQIESIFGYAKQMGSGLLLLVTVLLVLWIGRKYLQRRQFLRQLNIDRITPEELSARLAAGENVLIVDLRNRLTESPDLIAGAIRISPEDLAARGQEIPRDREIVLFCS